MPEMEVLLPNGYWQEGICHRGANVQGVREGDEDLEAQLAAAALPVARTTALLARCVTQLASQRFPGAGLIRRLSMGDREALLLHIRRMTFGEQIECVLQCPACADKMDFKLQATNLVVPPAETQGQYFEEEFSFDGSRLRARFRVPTGEDMDAALKAAPDASGEAVQTLLAHCVEWVRRDGASRNGTDIPVSAWPAQLASQISARMASLDPQAEIMLQITCPACGHGFDAHFDTADYFFRELSARERRLFREVHQLALAYHWSEAEILRMTPRKRRVYLELLAGETAP